MNIACVGNVSGSHRSVLRAAFYIAELEVLDDVTRQLVSLLYWPLARDGREDCADGSGAYSWALRARL